MRARASRPVLLSLLMLGTLSMARQGWAAWPHDPNNGNVALCTSAGTQGYPTIVSDGAGGAIVTWHDYRSGTSWDIYAQRVNAAGAPQWTANGVALCTAAGDQVTPTIVSDGAGGAIVTWQDNRSGTNDIYAQRVSATGVPQWTANGVALCTAASDQITPTIASDGAGGAIVTWPDLRSGTSYDIYAQRVSAAGVPQWTANGVALCLAVNSQYVPTIDSDGAGGAIVTWQDYRSGTNNDIYAQRVNAAGVPQWTADGVALCTAAGVQAFPMIASDGGGGAIVIWNDYRGTDPDIYGQRVNAAGVPQWTGNGVALCTAANNQFYPTLVSDGAGGAIVTWEDYRTSTNYDIYAQRVSAAGVPQWTANGVALCTAASDQGYPTIASDGAGGAIVTWEDLRSGTSNDIYAQRVSAAGVPQWTANGVALCTAVGDQDNPTIASDGAGGAIVTWYDFRSGTSNDIYAQRVERFGQLGNPEPVITKVSDVLADQGGEVSLQWTASYLDVSPTFEIADYSIWREAPAAVAQTALRAGARLLGPDEPSRGGSGGALYRAQPTAAGTSYWEYLVSVPARALPGYSHVTPTTTDSTGTSNLLTNFMVMTEDAGGIPFWASAPVSGYSVDNLPPGAPAPFTANYSTGATHLHWGKNSEPDLADYRLYRGSSAGFVPGPGNLVAAQPDTGYADVGAAGSYYKLSAVDIHGNESGFALVTPSGTTSVGNGVPRELALALASANPGRGGAALQYSLPQAGMVRLVVYDLAGRETRVLTSGAREAGVYSARWDGRNESGQPVSGGIYLVRLEAGERSLVRRLALLP
jgi:hypothetical protein